MAPISFRRRIVLTFVVGAFLLSGLFVIAVATQQTRFLYQQSNTRAAGLAEMLAVSSLSWVLADDVVGLQEVTGSFARYPDLRYVMVLSPTGRVLSHSDPARVGQFVSDPASRALLHAPVQERVITDTRLTVDVAMPLMVGGRHVGWARAAFGRDAIATNIRTIQITGLVYVAIATALALLAARTIARRLADRLDALAHVAAGVQAGDRSLRADTIGDDEVARVGRSLNAMVDALVRANAYTRSLIEASLDPLVTIDAGGTINDVNAATEATTGLQRDQLIGTDFSQYFTEPARARAGHQQVLREGEVRDYALEIRHRDGHSTPVLYNAAPFRSPGGAVAGVFAAARDITALQRAERDVRRLAAIVESSDDAIYSKSLDGIILTWNRGAAALYGYSADEAVGHSVTFLAAPDRPDEVPQILRRIGQGERVDHYETVRIRKGGAPLHVSLTLSPIHDAHGTVIGASTIARDITERIRMEAALRESEALHRTVIEAMDEGVAVHDASGAIITVNPSALRIEGRSVDQLRGRPAEELGRDAVREDGTPLPGAEHPACVALRSGTAQSNVVMGIRRPDGKLVWVSVNAKPIRDPEGHAARRVVTTFHDITERRRAEAALRSANAELSRTLEELRTSQRQVVQAEKLAALGTLAAGVAHELNNPLMGIMGYVAQVSGEVQDPALQRALARAAKELERMRDLLKNMLSFSRPMEERLTPIDVAQVVERALALLEAELRARSIVLRRDYAPGLPAVIGREGPLQQVVVNLVTNARDALADRPEKTITVAAHRCNDRICVDVTDTGSGIPEALQGRIFDPFVTTKPPGEGTGLGLAVSQNIVTGLGGTLTFHSRVGVGTTFTIALPTADTATT